MSNEVFIERLHALLRPIWPGYEAELRTADKESQSVDLWLYEEQGPAFCVSITSGFPNAGVLVDDYAFDQVPRVLVGELIKAVVQGRASIRSSHRTLTLSVDLDGETWFASREPGEQEIEDWERRLLR